MTAGPSRPLLLDSHFVFDFHLILYWTLQPSNNHKAPIHTHTVLNTDDIRRCFWCYLPRSWFFFFVFVKTQPQMTHRWKDSKDWVFYIKTNYIKKKKKNTTETSTAGDDWYTSHWPANSTVMFMAFPWPYYMAMEMYKILQSMNNHFYLFFFRNTPKLCFSCCYWSERSAMHANFSCKIFTPCTDQLQ